jgi:hypothetical protein
MLPLSNTATVCVVHSTEKCWLESGRFAWGCPGERRLAGAAIVALCERGECDPSAPKHRDWHIAARPQRVRAVWGRMNTGRAGIVGGEGDGP